MHEIGVYVYDGAGNKLEKTATTLRSQRYTDAVITDYDGPFVYTKTVAGGTQPPYHALSYIIHDEGRIQARKIDESQGYSPANTKYIYDYFIKDHLGSTRMVLSTEQQTDIYAATNETANASKENQLFNNLNSVSKPSQFDNLSISVNGQVSAVTGKREQG